jgi:hypothetical protein
VSAEELRRGVEEQVGAVIEGPQQPGRRERGIHHQRELLRVRDLRDGGHVQHVDTRVAERLGEEQPRVRTDRGAPAVEVARVHERRLDAEALQRVVQQVVRSAVERAARDDVRARARDRRDGEVQRGLSARGGDRADAAFERRDALFEHGVRRVRDARIDVAGALHVEERGGVVGVAEHERRRLVDRRRAGAGHRVGLLTGVQRERVEAEVAGSGHRGILWW